MDDSRWFSGFFAGSPLRGGGTAGVIKDMDFISTGVSFQKVNNFFLIDLFYLSVIMKITNYGYVRDKTKTMFVQGPFILQRSSIDNGYSITNKLSLMCCLLGISSLRCHVLGLRPRLEILKSCLHGSGILVLLWSMLLSNLSFCLDAMFGTNFSIPLRVAVKRIVHCHFFLRMNIPNRTIWTTVRLACRSMIHEPPRIGRIGVKIVVFVASIAGG
mmetsp:Transcript_7476/g.13068  ORF Transcript_7476/g.13068 Transcript_7476/m.13068 type:complete len:215 (-) Transcript_7476:246-890(-)